MQFIDSHTEGEPTRVILSGGPNLRAGTVAQQARELLAEHPGFYRSTLMEPRGHDAMVGALLVPSQHDDCCTGVIYYNPVGNLGMCGHATLGTAVTLAHMGRIEPGLHRFETPVGVVAVELHDAHRASVRNVESYRYRKDVTVEVPELGSVVGDIAWGGNWFFLTKTCPVPLHFDRIEPLTRYARLIMAALRTQGITGEGGGVIDHVEFIGAPHHPDARGRNFVLCPGGAYDRSPCGTGTSAKVACLAADGELAPGEPWVQESIIDSRYTLVYEPGTNGGVIPTVTGTAYVTAVGELVFNAADPYVGGIAPASGD